MDIEYGACSTPIRSGRDSITTPSTCNDGSRPGWLGVRATDPRRPGSEKAAAPSYTCRQAIPAPARDGSAFRRRTPNHVDRRVGNRTNHFLNIRRIHRLLVGEELPAKREDGGGRR